MTMNKKLVLLFSLLVTNILYSQQTLTDLALRPSEKLFVGIIENRKQQLAKLEQERAAFLKEAASRPRSWRACRRD